MNFFAIYASLHWNKDLHVAKEISSILSSIFSKDEPSSDLFAKEVGKYELDGWDRKFLIVQEKFTF